MPAGTPASQWRVVFGGLRMAGMIPIGSYWFVVLRPSSYRGEWKFGSLIQMWRVQFWSMLERLQTGSLITSSDWGCRFRKGNKNHRRVFSSISCHEWLGITSGFLGCKPQSERDESKFSIFSTAYEACSSHPEHRRRAANCFWVFFWGYQLHDQTAMFFAAARRHGADRQAAAKQLKICLSHGWTMRDGVDM